MHGYCCLLYIILIFFLSPHILSLSLTLSLQPIISATDQCNPKSPTTHRLSTATQRRQPHIDPLLQTDPPPPTTTTTTRTHHKINQKSNKPTHGHTTKSTKNQTHPHSDSPTEVESSIVASLWLWVHAWKSTGTSLDACGGDRSFWVDWNESLWIGACGSMLVTVRERGRSDFNQEGERERRVSSMEAVVSSRMESDRPRMY